MKEISLNITNEMAAQAGVKLNGGQKFIAQCTLVCKGRKIGEETCSVVAKSDKQARLAIKRVLETRAGNGVGVVVKACTSNGTKATEEEVHAMNTHGGSKKVETKEETIETVKEEIPVKKTENIKKVALVGETVDYTALGQALSGKGKKLLVGDATNKEHMNALFRAKNGTFTDLMVQGYLAHKGEQSVYSAKKLGFTPVCLSILTSMSDKLRAQFMKEALVNKASYVIGNAAPQPPKPETKKEEKPVTEATPATTPQEVHINEVKAKVIAKLIELGRELEDGHNVVEEINKFGSFAHQSLGMSEEEINALIQKGVNLAKSTNAKYEQAKEEERQELRKLGEELAENDRVEGDDDFYAEQGLTIQDEIDAIIGDGVLDNEEARAVVKEAYDSVYKPSAAIEIPDEEEAPVEESQDTPAEDNHEDELAELVLVSLKKGEAATARVMADFVLRNTNDAEEATEIITDILGLFSEVEDIAELANGLVIGGTLVRDGQYHKVVITEDFQGSLFA